MEFSRRTDWERLSDLSGDWFQMCAVSHREASVDPLTPDAFLFLNLMVSLWQVQGSLWGCFRLASLRYIEHKRIIFFKKGACFCSVSTKVLFHI